MDLDVDSRESALELIEEFESAPAPEPEEEELLATEDHEETEETEETEEAAEGGEDAEGGEAAAAEANDPEGGDKPAPVTENTKQ